MIIIQTPAAAAQQPASPQNAATGTAAKKPPLKIIYVGNQAGKQAAGSSKPAAATAAAAGDGAAAGAKAPAKRSPTIGYSAWDHLCVKYSKENLSDILNRAGDNGWMLTDLGKLGDTAVVCFERPKAGAHRITAAQATPTAASSP